jgi:hypothetical protein
MARPRKEAGRPRRVAFWVSEEIRSNLEAAAGDNKTMGDVANEALELYFSKVNKPLTPEASNSNKPAPVKQMYRRK